MSKSGFTPQLVHHIAQLAQLTLSSTEEVSISQDFVKTIEVVARMSELNTTAVAPTHQVTGLENVWRADKVDEKRMFTQAEALANAAKTAAGFFVVPQVIDQKDI